MISRELEEPAENRFIHYLIQRTLHHEQKFLQKCHMTEFLTTTPETKIELLSGPFTKRCKYWLHEMPEL